MGTPGASGGTRGPFPSCPTRSYRHRKGVTTVRSPPAGPYRTRSLPHHPLLYRSPTSSTLPTLFKNHSLHHPAQPGTQHESQQAVQLLQPVRSRNHWPQTIAPTFPSLTTTPNDYTPKERTAPPPTHAFVRWCDPGRPPSRVPAPPPAPRPPPPRASRARRS